MVCKLKYSLQESRNSKDAVSLTGPSAIHAISVQPAMQLVKPVDRVSREEKKKIGNTG